ncbi:membrane protein [Streptomyces sp. WM6349]|nr:membrane protein [Streptomyces sp. WM6349]KOV43374.1 membrane protein [Streptomyces sp. H036]
MDVGTVSVPGPDRDAGLQPERTRLAWRRTTLASSVVAVLALRQALRGSGSSTEIAGAAVIVLIWLVFLWVAHRRIRELATGRPRGLAPRSALAVVVCTVALAVFAMAVIL